MSSPSPSDSEIELVKVRKDKPWMTRELLLILRKRDRVHKRNKQFPTEKNLREAKELKSYVQQQIRKAKQAHELEHPSETTEIKPSVDCTSDLKMGDDDDAGSDCSSTEHGGAALKFKAENIDWNDKTVVPPIQTSANVKPTEPSSEQTKPKTNLIINYLPQTMTDDAFYMLFASIGQIKGYKVIRDVTTGYNYGFGFVDFINPDDAIVAIRKLNGLKLQHKTIKVAFARPSTDKTRNCNLYISGLVPSTDNDKLIEIFSKYGEIIHSRVLTHAVTKQCTGAGFVLFSNTDECDAAVLGLDGVTPEGWLRPIVVKFSKPKGILAYTSPAAGEQSNAGPIRTDRQYKVVRHQITTMGHDQLSQGVVTDPSLAQRDELGVIIFIRNFPLDTNEETLYSLFSPFGSVRKVKIMRDAAGDCRGFGFVTMFDDSAGVTAVLKLNRSTFGGRVIEVRFKLKEGVEGGHVKAVQSPYIPNLDMRNRLFGGSAVAYQEEEQYAEPEGLSISQQALHYANQQRMQQQGYSNQAMNTNMGGMNMNMGGMNMNMGGMNRPMMGMNNNMGGMNPNMGGMNPNMGGMGTNMGGMSINMGGMNPNMGGMGTNMGGMGPNMSGMNTNMGGMNANMGGMNANMVGMNANMGVRMNMRGVRPKMNANVGVMNANMMGRQMAGMAMNRNMAGMNANMSGPGTNMDRFQMRAAGIQSRNPPQMSYHQSVPEPASQAYPQFEEEEQSGGLFDYTNY